MLVGVLEVRLTPTRTISACSRFSGNWPSSCIMLKLSASIRLKYSVLSMCCAPARGVEFCPRYDLNSVKIGPRTDRQGEPEASQLSSSRLDRSESTIVHKTIP